MRGDDRSEIDEELDAQMRAVGFAFVPAVQMRELLGRGGELSDWAAFTASWDELVVDAYLVDHGRFRRRRHAVFAIDSADVVTREPHQPHYQSRDYNSIYGGVERWFEPITDAVGDGSSLRSILHFCSKVFGGLASDVRSWRVEVHQFRIEARTDEPGLPTPEGMHRDGVDYVLVLLVTRRNIASGTTTIHDHAGNLLGSFTLTQPFDAAFVDDARVFHGVTPVQPLDPGAPAHRDVLVVTFKRA